MASSLLRKWAFALALIPLPGGAACLKNDPGSLWNYEGTIGNGLRVRMTLVFAGEQINGLYLYASQLRDIVVKGTIRQGSAIVLEEFDAQGRATARFEGSFVERDPQGRYGNAKLECETIVGTWQKLDSTKQLPFYLTVESSTGGTLGNRYAPAGAQDDERVHRQALAFRDAVKKGDRNTVASLVDYPIKVNLPTGVKNLRTPLEMVANYDAVFTPRFREAIVNAVPRNMFVRDQGIMLGSGEVWFGPDGKVIALSR